MYPIKMFLFLGSGTHSKINNLKFHVIVLVLGLLHSDIFRPKQNVLQC